MKALSVFILLFLVGCASKDVIIKKYEPTPEKKKVWEISDEKLHEMEKQREYLKVQLLEKEDEIRAYRAHLGLPQKKSGKKIIGYKESGEAVFESGHYDTVEEELNALHRKKVEESKPVPQTIIIQNPKKSRPSFGSPYQNIDHEEETGVLEKAFGY